MRTSHVCPKCQHTRILLIDAVPDVGEHASQVRQLSVATVKVGESWIGNPRLATAGGLSAVVCRRCGYTEFYTEKPESIPVDGTYVRELVGPAR